MSVNRRRQCIGCAVVLDLVAHFTGERVQDGWLRTMLGYVCPGCRASGHIPRRSNVVAGTAAAACACGWQSNQRRDTSAELLADWRQHHAASTTPSQEGRP